MAVAFLELRKAAGGSDRAAAASPGAEPGSFDQERRRSRSRSSTRPVAPRTPSPAGVRFQSLQSAQNDIRRELGALRAWADGHFRGVHDTAWRDRAALHDVQRRLSVLERRIGDVYRDFTEVYEQINRLLVLING